MLSRGSNLSHFTALARCSKSSLSYISSHVSSSTSRFNIRCGNFSRIQSRLNHDQSLIRNLGVVAHIDAGKTTTSEQMLFLSGQTSYVGRVDSGDTVMDFLPQERERGITISSAATSLPWKGHQINLIDTPGHVDFTIEVERACRVLDGVVLVVDAVAGVQAQTQTVWKQTRRQDIPAVAFVNKMDRDGASFSRTVASIKKKLGANAVPIQFPVGSEDSFVGVVDLISMNKLTWASSNSSNNNSNRNPAGPTIEPISKDDPLYADVLTARQEMLESIAELDESFMTRYLDNDNPESFTVGDIIPVIRRISLKCDIVPVVCGASLRGKGVEPILDCVLAFLPSPLDRVPARAVNNRIKDKPVVKSISQDSDDFCALAFKIVHDRDRGLMVYFRIYSGVLSMKKVLRNSTKNTKERINQILKVNANEYKIVQEMGPGSVGCLIGLKGTATGDTLVYEKEACHDFVLDGLVVPPPVYSIAIEPETSTQQQDLVKALEILCLEDPSLVVEYDKESGQTLIKGIGELHLDIVCDKLKRQFNISVFASRTYIGFRETIAAVGDEGIVKSFSYDKVYGTKRLFATINCTIFTPAQGDSLQQTGSASDNSVEITKTCKDQCTSDEYNSLLDGIQSAFLRGPEGFPIVGLKIVVNSIEKDSDTTPGSLRACAAMMVDNIMRNDCQHTLLEPIMSLEAEVPNQFAGDVLSDLGNRRAQITEVIPSGFRTVILGTVPLSTMLGYATAIRSMTQGEGQYSMEYKGYEPVDISLVRKVM